MQARATPSRGQRFFTNHESRVTKYGFFHRGARRAAPPETAVRTTAPPASRCFPVRHCSPCSLLFAIVQQKILSCAIALAPPGRCFPARCGAAWRGYGAAWAAAVPRAGNTACWVFTSHETRNMVFPCPSGDSRENSPKPGQQVFHESRDTSHESRPLRFCRCFPARCGAAWRGYGAAWAAAAPRAGNTACWVFISHETRNMVFPCPSGDSRESNPKPGQRVFHESRITRHESRPLCFSSHDFSRFPGISRHFPAPHPPGKGSASRSVAAPAASGLLPPRLMPNETMLRKEKNVLVRVDSALCAFAGSLSRSLS